MPEDTTPSPMQVILGNGREKMQYEYKQFMHQNALNTLLIIDSCIPQ